MEIKRFLTITILMILFGQSLFSGCSRTVSPKMLTIEEALAISGEYLDQTLHTEKPGKYILSTVLYEDEKQMILLLKSGQLYYGSDYDIPRYICRIVPTKNGTWKAEGMNTSWETPDQGWEDLEKTICELYTEYRTPPSEEIAKNAVEILHSAENLSACFPSAGSSPEVWEELKGHYEVAYDPSLSDEQLCREYFRVFGAESLRVCDIQFAVALKKTKEIDAEMYPNIDYFFREDGDGDKLYIIVEQKADHSMVMKADRWCSGLTVDRP